MYNALTDSEIVSIYSNIKKYHEKYLKDKNIDMPKLYKSNNQYSKNALTLVYLAKDYPNTKFISKQELTDFIKCYYQNTTDVQQARHLAMQKGWYIESSTRGDTLDISKGCYKLKTLKEPYPGYIKERRNGFIGDFENIKQKYGGKCATCGSKEGKKHLFRKNVIVHLQEGHMNPLKDLNSGNLIPQCQICNGAYKSKWIFDSTGRVIDVAHTKDGFNIIKRYIFNCSDDELKKLKELLR